MLLSPLVDRLLAVAGLGSLLVFALNRCVAALERRRDARRAAAKVIEESERAAAIALSDAVHDAHQTLRNAYWNGRPGDAIAQMADELDAHIRHQAFALTDPEVRDRVDALGAYLCMSLAVEESDGELDADRAGYALERAVVNAREALIAYSRGEPLRSPAFPARSEFPRIMWMVPRAQRWNLLFARLNELGGARRAA